jgi:hypothetical protein
MPHKIVASYLENGCDHASVKELVKKAVRKLKKLDFDSIAFRGVSGALIAPIVAYKLKKPVTCIRKPTEPSHGCGTVEGAVNFERYIIIDDFISTGDTVNTIRHTLVKFAGDRAVMPNPPPIPKCIAIYLWKTDELKMNYFGDLKLESLAKTEVKSIGPELFPGTAIPEGVLGVPSNVDIAFLKFGSGLVAYPSSRRTLEPPVPSGIDKCSFEGCVICRPGS